MPKCVFERLPVGRFVIVHKAIGWTSVDPDNQKGYSRYRDVAGIIIAAGEHIDNSYTAWPEYQIQTPDREIERISLDIDCITPVTYKEVLGAHLMIKNGLWTHDHNHGFDAPVIPEGVVMKPNISGLSGFTIRPPAKITKLVVHHTVVPEDV